MYGSKGYDGYYFSILRMGVSLSELAKNHLCPGK